MADEKRPDEGKLDDVQGHRPVTEDQTGDDTEGHMPRVRFEDQTGKRPEKDQADQTGDDVEGHRLNRAL